MRTGRADARAHRRTGCDAERVGASVRRPAWRLGVLASALLAAAACGRQKADAVAAVEAAADTADQLMIGVTQYITQDGVRKANLQADTAFLYEDVGKADLKKVKVTFFGPTGDTSSVVTGDQGFYNWRTGAMEARGNVVVLLSNGGRLTTSVLHYDLNRNEVSTDQHYVYTAPDRNMEGEGFVTDPALSTFRTQRARGTAGSVTVPGR